METLIKIYCSSIGKKYFMGLTGILLCTFLVVHLGGNLLLFRDDGGQAFNAYAEFLPRIVVIKIIEILLFALFIGHILTGLILWIRNKKARPQNYTLFKPSENSTLFSRTMVLTGSVIFIFLVIHLNSFWVPAKFAHEANLSMYAIVKAAFSNPWYVLFYLIALGLLAFHLRHGFQSAFQTFGLKHHKYATFIEAVGVIFWLLIPLTFASMPVYFYLNSLK